MFFTLLEILYILITVIVIGYIFSAMFRHETKNQDILARYTSFTKFNWEDIKFGVLIAAPGIIFHELAHKFTAMFLGLNAYYEIYPTGLIIGIILRLLNSGFLILAPGYVVISNATQLQSILTAFAGPFTNLLLFIISLLILKYTKNLKPKTALILAATKQINMWLFIFNMIPVPPLDGSKVILPLLSMLF